MRRSLTTTSNVSACSRSSALLPLATTSTGEAVAPQMLGHQLGDLRLVVDHEDAAAAPAGRRRVAAGSRRRAGCRQRQDHGKARAVARPAVARRSGRHGR